MHQKISRIVVLSTELTGESTLRLDCLSADLGQIILRKRVSTKLRATVSSTPRPDVFDTAIVRFDPTTHFLNDYELLRRRDWLGSDYRLLSVACELGHFLIRNLTHIPEAGQYLDIVERALDGMTSRDLATIAFLKAVFSISRNEGYAVQEGWITGLSSESKHSATTLLNSPLSELQNQALPIAQLKRSLLHWLSVHSDFEFDRGMDVGS